MNLYDPANGVTLSEPMATIIAALLAVFVTAMITLFVFVIRKLFSHDIALALILQELYPSRRPNLRRTIEHVAAVMDQPGDAPPDD